MLNGSGITAAFGARFPPGNLMPVLHAPSWEELTSKMAGYMSLSSPPPLLVETAAGEVLITIANTHFESFTAQSGVGKGLV